MIIGCAVRPSPVRRSRVLWKRFASSVEAVSEEEKNKKLAYLRAWAGTPPPVASPPSTAFGASSVASLEGQPPKQFYDHGGIHVVPAAPFCLPIVRLRKGETVESLKAALATGLLLENGLEGGNSSADIVPVVVDLTELRINVSAVASIASVKRLLAALDTASSQQPHPTQHQRTVPVGVFVKEKQGQQHSDTTNKKLSAALGFPAICPSEAALGKLVPSSSSMGDPAAPLTTNKAAAAAAADDDGAVPSGGVTLFEGNIRSGQQVFAAPGQSLLVYGSVNPGGEVLADRSIYIWGALRGRAFAGIASTSSPSSVKGADGTEEDFKVVTQRFDAELVSIAQTFATMDSLPHGVHTWARETPTTITLDRGEKKGTEPRLAFYSEPTK